MRRASAHARSPLAALTLLSLASCAVGPHYRRPTPTAVAAQGFSTATPAADPAGELPPRWWSLYDDPVLDRLVADALAHNSDLRVAAANLERARAVITEQRASLLPTTLLTGSAIRGRSATNGQGGVSNGIGVGGGSNGTGTSSGAGGTSGGTSGGGNTTITAPVTDGSTQTVYRGGATLSYELDLFGRVRRSIEAARDDAASREAARDLVRVTVAAATTQAYLDGCAIGRQVEVARSSLRLVQESYDITLRQRDLGATTDYELARVGVLLEQTRAAVPSLEGQRRSVLFDLARLTGRAPADVPAAAAACRVAPTLARPLPVGDGAGLLRRRPDVREAERTLAADVARVGVATANLFPTVTLGGTVSAVGTGFNAATSRSGVSFGFGPLVNWFVPNIVAARARLSEAGAQARADLATFDGTVLTALGEIEKALATYDAERRRNAALRAAEQASRRASDLAGARLRFGTISQLEQIDVARDLIATQAQLAESDTLLAEDQVVVFRALGGGWQEAPAIDPAPRAVEGTGGVRLKAPQP